MSTDRNDRGQILVIVALASVALMLVVGLVIDGGFAWSKRREAQNAADLAALAGTRVVAQNVSGTARTNQDVYSTLSTIATANNNSTVPGLGTALGALYVDSNGSPIAGLFVTNAATAIPAAARGVQVPASRAWRPFFLGLIGVTNWTATASATARTTVGASAPCAFCALGTSPPGPPFTMQSAGTQLRVNNGAIAINSGLDMQGNPTLQSTGTGAAINVFGTRLICNNCFPSPAVTPMTSAIPDPLAFLANPTATGTNFGNISASGPNTTTTLNPGRYGTLTISANATVFLNPGTYYFSGDVSPQSNATLTGANVTLVFMGPQTSFLPQSNSTINITSPAPTDATATFPGLAFYFARGNVGTLQMQSSSTTQVTGSIYARDALLDMQSGTTFSTINSLVVVGKANLQGSPKLTVNYNASQNVQIPGGASLVK